MFLQTPYKFYKRILSDSIISIFLLLETSNSRKLKNIFFEQMKTRNIRTIIYTGTLIRKLLCFTFNLSPRLCSHVVHFMLVIRKFLKDESYLSME